MLDDDRLINAVDESVNIALNILEKEAIYTRYTDDNGSEIREKTGQMITSVYPHSTSRSCIEITETRRFKTDQMKFVSTVKIFHKMQDLLPFFQ